jgi:Methyltransferase domain
MDLLERDGDVVSRHPWELARSKFFVRLVRRFAPASRDVRLLDVGAGDAWFSAQLVDTLPAGSRITCWDVNYSEKDLSLYARHSSSLTLTAEQPDDKYGGILMLDVVEHVEDDIGFVSRIVESRLERDGWVLVSVPAYQSLFTSHDNAVKHFRRYSPRQAAAVLEAAGLRVEAQGGLFHSLLVVRGTQAAKERLSGPKGTWVGPGGWSGGPRLTRAMVSALGAESRMSEVFGTKTRSVLPGLSYWAFCRRAELQ